MSRCSAAWGRYHDAARQRRQRHRDGRYRQAVPDVHGTAAADDEAIVAEFQRTGRYRGWPAARLLCALAEHELAERDRRRIQRHLSDARLLPGKSLNNFEFPAVPMLSKARVMALAAGDAWLNQGANCLIFGPPGAGKSHLASALGLALVEQGYRVLFTRTTDLVQRLNWARAGN